jgi:hypothetical protein
MGTWSRGAPLLPAGSAADPGPGRRSPEPEGSAGAGCDAARTARRRPVKARPGQHAQPLGFDPDDAKTAPRPSAATSPATAKSVNHRGDAADTVSPAAATSVNHRGDAADAASPAAAGPADHHDDPAPAGQRSPVPGLRRPAQPQRKPANPQQEPPWSTVIATTIRLWWERRGRRLWRARGRRQRRVVASALAVAVVAGGLAVALTQSGGKSPGQHLAGGRGAPGQHRAGGGEPPGQHRPGGGANPVLSAQTARSDAAAWIDQQVSRGTIVSCDPVMCSALLAHGFPAANLDLLRPSAHDPLASDMIAATAVLRSQFGSRLTSVYAPITVASFGTGSAEVAIRVVAPDGSAAYMRQFRADLAARKAYGAQMLHNSKIVVAPQTRRQLASGMVDSRLLATISTAAHRENPLRIVSFGAAAPGGSSGVPVRSAVIASTASGPKASIAVLDQLRRFWLGQQAPYLPASTQIVPDGSGQSALRIQFAAPSQLGLLSAGNPVVKTPR